MTETLEEKCKIDLVTLMGESISSWRLPESTLLKSTIFFNLPPNSLQLKCLIVFPLSEFESSPQTLQNQYDCAQEQLSKKGTAECQLVLIPPAGSKQYQKRALPGQSAFNICADNLSNLSQGRDVTIVCYPGAGDKARLEASELANGQDLVYSNKKTVYSGIFQRWAAYP